MTDMTTVGNFTPDTPLQVRPISRSHWYRIDNVVFDRYAELIGLDGFGLYAALCRYANNHTQQCWPSAMHLATKLQTTVDTVATCLERLQAVGLVHIKQRPGACPLITLLDPRITEPVVPMPLEPEPAPELEPCPPVEIEKTEPVAAKEDLQKDLEQKNKETKLFSLSSSEGEANKESLVFSTHARETSHAEPALDPSIVSPYELAVATREVQC